MKSATRKESTMKAILATSLIVLLVVAANLIGLIAVATAASLLGAGNVKSISHPAHHSPAAHFCAQTCPLHTTNS